MVHFIPYGPYYIYIISYKSFDMYHIVQIIIPSTKKFAFPPGMENPEPQMSL